MKVALFLGSGVSTGCGLPDVDDITKSIFDDKWHNKIDSLPTIASLETNSQIELSAEEQRKDALIRIQDFLKEIKSLTDKISKKYHDLPINYEHLYEITSQLNYRNYYSIINPTSIFLYEVMNDSLQEHLTPMPTSPYEENNLSCMARLAHKLINDIIKNELETAEINRADFTKLGLILELANSPTIEKLDIYTTNHDLLIEKLLTSNHIGFADGFEEPKEGIRRYNANTYNSNVKVKLYKLHGSIDWYGFMHKDNSQGFLGIPVDNEISHYKKSDGAILSPVHSEPYFLTGINNKILDYEFSPYAEIIFRFQNSLEDHDILIESGYGWNDIGINDRLVKWLDSAPQNQIVLLHQEPEKEIQNKSHIGKYNKYNVLVAEEKIIISCKTRKWLSECNCDEILSYYKA